MSSRRTGLSGRGSRSTAATRTPRWRNRHTRVSQKHAAPGSNPGWGTSFLARAKAGAALLQLGCGKQAPPRVQRVDRPRGGAAAGVRPPTILSRCSAAGKRAWSGTTRPQVRVLPARPLNTSVAQRDQSARLRTARPRVRILPEVPTWRRNSEERVPACRAGGRGFKSRRCRQCDVPRGF